MTPEDALHLRAIAASREGRNQEAVNLFRELARMQPNSAEVWHNFGVALKNAGLAGDAITAYSRSLELNSQIAETHTHLGIALAEKGRFDEARQCYRRALELKPDFARAHWNYALELLVSGDLEQGWPEFEWRLEMAADRLKRNFPQPRWKGEDPRGKTILLHAEGGFGDALQFVRYAPMVADRGARVLLECPAELLPLLRRVRGISASFARGESPPAFDWQIPLQSLPGVFGTNLQNIPAMVPYISAPQESISRWSQRLVADSSLKVGLVWAGSGTGGDARDLRSRSLELFAPFSSVRGVAFHGLQKGPDADQPGPAGLRLERLGAELLDFADTAAAVLNLDLVISVDSSVAHLAGALGQPVWTLIPSIPDFRWLRERRDSPWYPTMRLFRQGAGEGWHSIVERMADELALWAERNKK